MISDPTARQAGRNIAERIRQELVCCDIYQRINHGSPSEDEWKNRMAHAVLNREWHDLCYWGEASARIAEGRCPQRPTVPDVCQCDCSGCLADCGDHFGSEDDSEPKCNCGHTEWQHIPFGSSFGPQCKVCPEDGEGAWKHEFTQEEVS